MEYALQLSVNTTTKKVRLTDITDYSDFDLSLYQAKGLGTISFQGELLYSKTTIGDPLIDLQSGATYFEFDAVLDSNGDIANGSYSADYSVRMAISGLQFSSSGVVTTVIGDGEPQISEFLIAGNTLTFRGLVDVDRVIVTVNALVSGNPSFTLDSSLDMSQYDDYGFDVTNPAVEQSWTYAGCTLVSASVNLTSDCNYGDNGTWSVYNTTVVTTQELVSTDVTINYPSWTGESAIEVTSLPYTNNRLATGTYSVVANFTYQQTENDGLIIEYVASCTSEFVVRCAQPLCSLNTCIEALRVANSNAISSGKASPFTSAVDNVTLLWIEAQNYLACGELSSYQTTVEAIQAVLDSSGCECDCCDDDELRWVYNTSEAAQNAIETLQAQVEALENPTVYNKVIFDSVLPVMADNGELPSNNFFRPMTDLSEITIPKEYLQPSDNGYPKMWVEIEMSVYLSGQSYSASAINAENSTNIMPSLSSVALDGEFRLKVRLYTYEVGTSGIYQVVQGEGFTIDDGPSPNVASQQFFDQNVGFTLWDTEEDLVLDFTPADTSNMGFVEFKITAIAIP